MRLRKILLLLGSMVVLTSCATGARVHYNVSVNSIARPDVPGKKVFVIANSNDSVLQKQEYQGYVEHALELQGYNVVKSMDESETVVVFSYAVGSQDQIAVRPIYSWGTPTGTIGPVIIGVHSYTIISRAIYLSAFNTADAKAVIEKKASTQPAELWVTTITSAGHSADMRNVFPALLAASRTYFGENTEGLVDVRISVSSPKIDEVVSGPTAKDRLPAAQ